MSRTRRFLLVVGGVALLAGALPAVLSSSASLFAAGTVPDWFPRFGSVGRTVVAYLWAGRVLAFLLVPVAAVGAGYAASDDVELAGEPRLAFGFFLFVGVVCVVVGAGIAVLALALGVPHYPGDLPHPVTVFLDGATRGIAYGIAAFAGAAVGAFEPE